MIRFIKTTGLLLLVTWSFGQEISYSDFQVIEDTWNGHLVYLDYSSNKEVMIPVRLDVEKMKEGRYVFSYTYPEEPKANSKSKIAIDLEGAKIAGDLIKEIKKPDDGWTIIAEGTGKDNGKKAKFIKTYSFSLTSLSIKKEVQYEDSNEVFLRNEYRLGK